ncbi:MAG: response regulator, partial [Chloroflexi bacterium]
GHNLPFDPNLVTPPTSSWSYAEAVTSFCTYLDQRSLQPRFDFDAVAAVNDESAYAAITVLKSRGARVPDDIAVTGFDDLAMAGSVAPPLTTVRAPFHAMGRRAVEILLGRLHGEEYSEPFVLPAQLIVRHSCGCLLPTITEAAASVDEHIVSRGYERQGLAAALNEERSAIVMEMANAVGGSSLALQCAGQLLNGFIGEIEHGTGHAFLSALDAVLNQVATQRGRVKEWQRAISVMQRRIMPYLLHKKTQVQANNLWHQARVMVGEAAWRHQSWKRLRTEGHARDLRAIGTRLSTAQTLDDLLDILAIELPAFGVPCCYLSLYVDPLHPGESARLVFGYDEHGPLEIAPDQRVFPAKLLAPEKVWSRSERFSLLVEPLYHRMEQLGFVVFETGGIEGGRDGELWDALQMQISSALMAVQLHQEAVNARREAEAGWQLAEERQRAAEEANQLKSRFLSMVSHEMRTPLNVITGLSENLIQQRPADNNPALNSVYRDLERINISAQHLDNLIRDVLDLAVSHVGQLKLVLERLEILDVLCPVIEIGERMAAEKGLAWQLEIPDSLPRISYDRTRLRQVVLNLISNAVKFTDQGEVALCIQATTKVVTILVRDTGLGIPKEDQGLIFEEFRRTERASTRGYGGLGLGLAICRRLVELGGGRIGVESTGAEGGGSTFFFSLPALEESHEAAELAISKVYLLSNRESSQNLFNLLVQGGFEVKEIRIDTQADWLRPILDAPPGAVVLDIQDKNQQGWEVVNAFRSNPALQEVPILFCSLFDNRGAVIEMNYLDKPISANRLVRALEQQGLIPDHQARNILLVDDDQAILDLHTRLVEQRLPGCLTRRARNGREALDEMRRVKPDLVLLDLMMPEMNGFEVLEEMRKDEDLRSIPVIVMTSQKLSEHEMQQFNNGVAAVLEKGLFSAEETYAQLSTILGRSKHLGSEARRVARLAMAYIHEHYREPIARKD